MRCRLEAVLALAALTVGCASRTVTVKKQTAVSVPAPATVTLAWDAAPLTSVMSCNGKSAAQPNPKAGIGVPAGDDPCLAPPQRLRVSSTPGTGVHRPLHWFDVWRLEGPCPAKLNIPANSIATGITGFAYTDTTAKADTNYCYYVTEYAAPGRSRRSNAITVRF